MMTFVSAARPGREDRAGKATHGFLDGPRPFFASYHAAARPVRDIGYVICPPLGWEGIQCYQSVRLLAEQLAASGFHTIRVDYDGTGESLGSDDDPGRVPAWLESVHRATISLAALREVDRVGLIGMRVGATLAGTVAVEIALANLVLWEPCVSGAQYSREMEIMASASPTALQEGRVPGSSHGTEAGGYLLSHETIASLNALDLQKVTPLGRPDVLIVCRDDRPPGFSIKLKQHLEREGCRALLEQLPGHKDMMVPPEKSVPADVILSRIRQWAIEGSQVAADGGEGGLTLAEDAIAGRTRRRPVRFGPSQRLFGILTEPVGVGVASGAARRPVLLLTGGAVPRTSRNRMYIVLATRLAEMGHTVLRMDVSGIGESSAVEGALPNDPYTASLLEDVGCAVQLLVASSRQETISLLGLCSGAYATFQTALADSHVRAAVLLNPEVFHLRNGSPRFSQTELSLAAKQYRRSFLSVAAWRKLLSGHANVRYIARFASTRLETSLTSALDRLLARIRRVPQGLAGDFHHLLARAVKVGVVVAQGDPGQDSLMHQLGPDLDALGRSGFRLKTVPGPDHTFNDFSVRQQLLDWLVEILSETGC